MEKLRTCRFSPYRKGHGPTFTVTLFYRGGERLGASDSSARLGYRMTMCENGSAELIFSGRDFRPSPMHAVDSDESVKALMGFLTLRPGDTDREYFDDYSAAQLAYCEHHAEALGAEVYSRFGE